MPKSDYSKRILRLLARKPALPIKSLTEEFELSAPVLRSLKGLQDAGFIERHHSGQKEYARLTKDGKKKAHSIALESDTTLVNPAWDGKWRVILLDLPEERKQERDGLRYLLKKAGFACLKNAVWISPLPYEHLFGNIKKDLGLTTELMIFVTDSIDQATEAAFAGLIK